MSVGLNMTALVRCGCRLMVSVPPMKGVKVGPLVQPKKTFLLFYFYYPTRPMVGPTASSGWDCGWMLWAWWM